MNSMSKGAGRANGLRRTAGRGEPPGCRGQPRGGLRLIPCARSFALLASFLAAGLTLAASAPSVHVWDKVEITFEAERTYPNPYTDAQVWVDLTGPGFQRRCYGFWDGGATFRVRVLATAPGQWTWLSGSEPADPGLAGRRGSFTARAWTEAEKAANVCRRGNRRATANGRAFEHADGIRCRRWPQATAPSSADHPAANRRGSGWRNGRG
ncbi:MAG: DUF5060 domain-containing protein [Verrucomicrobia bacterium]|nr:DUF5060 domain-containing protein [Verrucomicrobiota bacterium]